MIPDKALTSLIFGLISAVSLPLGAMTILIWRPGPRMTSFLMAFGGGTLLAALTIDLVGESLHRGQFFPLAIGCIMGGFLFVFLNHALNSQGGFLRKPSTTINYIKGKNAKRYKELFKKLSGIPLFNSLPPEEIGALLPFIHSHTYPAGEQICRQGERGTSMFIIEEGEVNVIDEQKNQKIDTLRNNDILGEIAIITGETRTATARAAVDTKVWFIDKEDFDKVLQASPKLAAVIKDLVTGRLAHLKDMNHIEPQKADDWARIASKNIDDKFTFPTDTEIKREVAENKGAPLAIWLGILLDGIPESLVIGASLVHASISISLIAGLFLSNYPEALTSSQGMRQQGTRFMKIFWMWFSLMVITGIGALIGNILFQGAPAFLFHMVEGMAAGAMLTMIAETMLPEAFHKGGSITGISTLMGFLTAIFFKVLDKYIG
ncbi:MAG: cyclic nucleotide-binding domain-containing protein [Spirochaetes bacterium]|nr:cyclic nucleotide-binding domain-containing protein [Spirochaetota bacterium]